MTPTLNIDKSNWKKYRFDEVCRQVNESSKNPAEDGLVHVIGLEHIEPNNLHITQWDTLEKETTFTRKFVKGQVLFGRRRAYQRKVAYAEFDGICSGDILVFEAIKDKMVPELLPFLIQSDGFFAKALETSAGSLSPRTKFKELADYEFLLPSLAEQRRLAELIWAADEMIEKEKRELEGVERMYEVFCSDYFSKPFCNNLLSDCISSVVGGGTPNTKQREYYAQTGLPWITTTSLDDIYVDKGERYITQEGINKSATNILKRNSLIIGTRVGVGKCSINWVDMCFSQDCTGLLVDKNLVDLEYLLFHLRSAICQNYFKSHCRGTTILGITKADLLNVPINLPKIEEQISIKKKLFTLSNGKKITW